MLTFLVVTIIVLIVFVGLALKHNMALINTLAPRLQELQAKVNTLSLNVQLLKDNAANAAEIPSDVEAALSNLSSSIDAVVANSQP